MNEQLRQRAQEIADKHGNDAYSVALAMLEGMNKVKAEAVREYHEELIAATNIMFHPHLEGVKSVFDNKLENQND